MDATYRRYHIEAKTAPHILPHPHRFRVKVKKLGLAKLLLKEFFHYGNKWDVIKSRPCVYGVFSGPVGGFAPREKLCVGCLRCTTEHPEMVSVLHHPARQDLGDSFFTPDLVDTVVYEAETGRVLIRGAGYRGIFGGEGWDGMWTDMSEIVRPTRDGIHGREFISTETFIGGKQPFLTFGEVKQVAPLSIPLPLLFDALPDDTLSQKVCLSLVKAASDLQTLTILPLEVIEKYGLRDSAIIPLITPAEYEAFKGLQLNPQVIELTTWDRAVYEKILADFPQSHFVLRTDFERGDLINCYHAGVRIFHFTANYHGKGRSGKFVLDLIREAHQTFVQAECRDEVTLIGSGGIIAAEHVGKAIICGLDAVALDTSVLVALQANFDGECVNRERGQFKLPSELSIEWGRQRLKNLACSWRDQLLEILGAMGIRDVRRLRGEMGRAMFQHDLEREAFETQLAPTGQVGFEGIPNK